MNLLQIVDHVGSAIDVAGVSVIVIGCVIACSLFLTRVAREPARLTATCAATSDVRS